MKNISYNFLPQNFSHHLALLGSLICTLDCIAFPCIFLIIEGSQMAQNYLESRTRTNRHEFVLMETLLAFFQHYTRLAGFYFVLPLAILAVAGLYYVHRDMNVTCIGIMGIFYLGIAHINRRYFSYLPHQILAPLQLSHLITFCISFMGSSLLIISNYMATNRSRTQTDPKLLGCETNCGIYASYLDMDIDKIERCGLLNNQLEEIQ